MGPVKKFLGQENSTTRKGVDCGRYQALAADTSPCLPRTFEQEFGRWNRISGGSLGRRPSVGCQNRGAAQPQGSRYCRSGRLLVWGLSSSLQSCSEEGTQKARNDRTGTFDS